MGQGARDGLRKQLCSVSDHVTAATADVIPMESLLEARVVEEASGLPFGFAGSGVIVEVELDREKVFASGARCVSFSFLVSFHDIVVGGCVVGCVCACRVVRVGCCCRAVVVRLNQQNLGN